MNTSPHVEANGSIIGHGQAVVPSRKSRGRLRRVNKEIIGIGDIASSSGLSVQTDRPRLACNSDQTTNIKVELVGSSPFHLKGSFPGPEGTPYENGIFEVDVVYPELYPLRPMQVKFITKVYHPNISSVSGAIWINILQDGWSPILTVKTVLLSVQALLSSPEPSDSLDTEALKHYIADKCSFQETARYWTWIYARGPECVGGNDPEVDDAALAGIERIHIDHFEAFGFQRARVIEILCKLNYRGHNVANIPDEVVIEELLE
ncbi:ubiquitin-conjugating enzyme/RWD-like protein [Pisolithus croceorrhizus]|nr:ubiquitin-conjugating enzyme/RWD-like protein [Pisolithus croceorrhizus]KAI6116518.1 ubiquitin-conjugating enzyme/RWD-like protein [Pisolithus croceorrhizus]KAI6166386.1 ubiquitin-conjugating enzyme/RWD-like protein [Pisolithus thermaeus]